jgi:hypothetical protein
MVSAMAVVASIPTIMRVANSAANNFFANFMFFLLFLSILVLFLCYLFLFFTHRVAAGVV